MRQSVNDILAKHFPVEAVEHINRLLHAYPVRLKITRERTTKLGDFKPGINGAAHRISVNGSLNIYECLLVFLHEAAHMMVFEQHGRKCRPHGKEWKTRYGELIRQFLRSGCFHSSIHDMVYAYSFRVRASGIANLELTRTIRVFDRHQSDSHWVLLEEVAPNGLFKTRNGHLFQKSEKRRTRYRCLSFENKRPYLIHCMARVMPADNQESNAL